MLKDNRIRIIIGHYGSGKSEFAVNYAMKLSKISDKKIALADLDVVNPYFRSRERAEILENEGIEVISSVKGNKFNNLNIPMVSAGVLKLFQNEEIESIIDVGGDAIGARPMGRYKNYLTDGKYDMFAVINRYRAQTADLEGAVKHIKEIEEVTNAKVTGLINNTHLLRETTVEDVLFGQELVEEVAKELNIPVKYVCAIENIAADLDATSFNGKVFPIKLYMRPDWL
ncbi:ATP-binding protein [Clostridiaceae bacterium HSG29]|nr:ATP-binding protein [Clostridiaceae bacterium HSG29]